jgi:imidazolonepropionase-like amidohydrolase
MNRAVAGSWFRCLALLGALGAITCNAAAQPAVSSNFLVSQVRVFDGERVQNDMQVAVEAGVIRAIGRGLNGWSHLPVIDGKGATLLPGLIDAHSHVENVQDLRDALQFGVTTVLDMGTLWITPQSVRELRSVAAARLDIADVRSAGFGAPAPGGHGTEYQKESGIDVPAVASAELADAYVAARRSEGSDYLKIFINGVRSTDRGMPNLDRERVKALVSAAHARGMLTVAHVENLEDIEMALDAGIDGLAHVWRRGGVNAAVARRLATQKVFLIATLAVLDGFGGGGATLLADRRLQPYLSSAMKQQLGQSSKQPTAGDMENSIAVIRSLHEAGVVVLPGTDAMQTIPTLPGVSLHRELELLNRAGMSPVAALSAATARAADAFHLADRGRIAKGLEADMVLVRGDPTSDITATRDILRVWRSGVEVARGPTPRGQ